MLVLKVIKLLSPDQEGEGYLKKEEAAMETTTLNVLVQGH